MPFGIENRDGNFVVVNKATGSVKGRHGNKAKAIAQLDKLHMIERQSGELPKKKPKAFGGGGSDGKQNPFMAEAQQPDGGDPAEEQDEAGDDPEEEAQESQEAIFGARDARAKRKKRFGG